MSDIVFYLNQFYLFVKYNKTVAHVPLPFLSLWIFKMEDFAMICKVITGLL